MKLNCFRFVKAGWSMIEIMFFKAAFKFWVGSFACDIVINMYSMYIDRMNHWNCFILNALLLCLSIRCDFMAEKEVCFVSLYLVRDWPKQRKTRNCMPPHRSKNHHIACFQILIGKCWLYDENINVTVKKTWKLLITTWNNGFDARKRKEKCVKADEKREP